MRIAAWIPRILLFVAFVNTGKFQSEGKISFAVQDSYTTRNIKGISMPKR
jgi:hypothetical protein